MKGEQWPHEQREMATGQYSSPMEHLGLPFKKVQLVQPPVAAIESIDLSMEKLIKVVFWGTTIGFFRCSLFWTQQNRETPPVCRSTILLGCLLLNG